MSYESNFFRIIIFYKTSYIYSSYLYNRNNIILYLIFKIKKNYNTINKVTLMIFMAFKSCILNYYNFQKC